MGIGQASLILSVLLLVCFYQADAQKKYDDIGIVLSKNCITMISKNLPTNCPTYEEILTLFPDTSDRNRSGKFIFKDNMLQRGEPQMQKHYGWYDYQGRTMWIDPPADIREKIQLITIENNFNDYLIKGKSFDMGNYTVPIGHDRWVNVQCTESRINSSEWIFLLGDTIRYLDHQCDPSFTSFNHIRDLKFEKSYQDFLTSNKYKLEEYIQTIKEKYKVSMIGTNDSFENRAVITDEDER